MNERAFNQENSLTLIYYGIKEIYLHLDTHTHTHSLLCVINIKCMHDTCHLHLHTTLYAFSDENAFYYMSYNAAHMHVHFEIDSCFWEGFMYIHIHTNIERE
jgi:hypothetical protein